MEIAFRVTVAREESDVTRVIRRSYSANARGFKGTHQLASVSTRKRYSKHGESTLNTWQLHRRGGLRRNGATSVQPREAHDTATRCMRREIA